MSKLELQAGDGHLVFDDTANVCSVWRKGKDGGVKLWTFPMKNGTVNMGFGHRGWCPRGTFILGAPTDVHLIPFGHHFTPLFDRDLHGQMHVNGRSGIGIHGGGSGLHDPFAPEQGWQITEGCLRVQNQDNARLVVYVRMVQAMKRHVYCTVGGNPG